MSPEEPRRLTGGPGPVRLAILLQNLEYGGTQRYIVNYLGHVDRTLIVPEVWVMEGITDLVPQLRARDVEIVWLGRSNGVGPLALFRLWRLLRRRPPMVLYTLTPIPNTWGRILGRLAGVPAIISSYRTWVPKQMEKWLWPLSRRLICNARILRETMVRRFGVDPTRVAVISNGVDTEYFRPRPGEAADTPTVLFVGRLHAAKDPLNLVRAFRLVVDRIPEARLEMVGHGPLGRRVEDYIKTRGLVGLVRMIPGASDVRDHMARAWVVVLASAWEGSPNVIIEAMAMGRPVVATPVGGVPELVADGETGLLIPPGNPRLLAEALIVLLSDQAKGEAMGRLARTRVVARHALADKVRETTSLILEAAGRSPHDHEMVQGDDLRPVDGR